MDYGIPDNGVAAPQGVPNDPVIAPGGVNQPRAVPDDLIRNVLKYGRKQHGFTDDADKDDDSQSQKTLAYDEGGDVGIPDDQSDQAQGGVGDTVLGSREAWKQDPAKRALAWLTGAFAAKPEVADAAEKQVDPDSSMDPSDRKIHAIASTEDPDQQVALMQRYRKNYDTLKGFAANGADKGDMAMAAQAITQASSHLPDGERAQFTPTQTGVRAQVLSKSGETQNYDLTPEQFKGLLRSPHGMFDNVLDKGGMSKVLQGLGDMHDMARAPVKAVGATPKKDADDEVDEAGIPKKLWRQANKLFPWVSQETERNNYVRAQMQQDVENETSRIKAESPLGREQVKGEYGIRRQELRSNGEVLSALAKASGGVEREKVKGQYSVERQNQSDRANMDRTLATLAANSSDRRFNAKVGFVRELLKAYPFNIDMEQMGADLKKQGIDLPSMLREAGVGGGAAPAAPSGGAPAGGGGEIRYDAQGRAWRRGPNGQPVPAN